MRGNAPLLLSVFLQTDSINGAFGSVWAECSVSRSILIRTERSYGAFSLSFPVASSLLTKKCATGRESGRFCRSFPVASSLSAKTEEATENGQSKHKKSPFWVHSGFKLHPKQRIKALYGENTPNRVHFKIILHPKWRLKATKTPRL